MKFTEYISTHQAFTTADLMSAMDSTASAEQQLRLAVRSGAVERVRRGLLVSNCGRYEEASIDPYTVIRAADHEAVLSYHSALEAHGVTHNVSFSCQFRSDVIRSPFTFRGVRYVPCGPVGDTCAAMVRGETSRRLATTKEQTVVDCLGSPTSAGGPEEAIRSLTTFAYLDLGALTSIAKDLGPSMAARVGWLLSCKMDDWHVDEAALEPFRSLLGQGPYRLGNAKTGYCGWSAEWRLLLPETNEEISTWITTL